MRAAFRTVASLLLSTIVMAIGTASSVQAQTFQGGLRGTVRDGQGVVPAATVVLINQETKVSRETMSNAAGEYSFPAVAPGTYTVRANITGFKTFELKDVRIGTQQFVNLDVALEVGTITETITVTGQSPLIETGTASTGETLEKKTLESLPTIGRNVFLMANMVPTMVTSGDTHWNRMQDQTGASLISLGGGGVRQNNYLLDGFPVTDIQNRSATNPSIESVEEVKVQVHTYDAEMGRTGGGVFNVTAKSGTNAYRGSGYVQIRPNGLINENFFLKQQEEQLGPKKDPVTGAAAGQARRILAQRRRRVRRTDREEQDILLVCDRGVSRRAGPERHPPIPDAGRTQRRFLGHHRRAGPPGPNLRSAHDAAGQRRADARSDFLQWPAERHLSGTDESGRQKHRWLSPDPGLRRVQRRPELLQGRRREGSGAADDRQARPSVQRQRLAERLLPAAGNARAKHELLRREQVRRAQLPTRSLGECRHHQQYLRDQLQHGHDDALRLECVRRRQSAAVPVRCAHARVQPHLCGCHPRAEIPRVHVQWLQRHGLHRPAGSALLLVRVQRHAHEALLGAQLQNGRRLPAVGRGCADLWPVGGRLHVQRHLHAGPERALAVGGNRQLDCGPAARLSVERHDGPADADSRVHALLQRVHPGRLAPQRPADDQLRAPSRA